MKVAVIGAGLMGPTISKDCLESPDVSEVLLIDIDHARLDHVSTSLKSRKLRTLMQDVKDRRGLADSLKGYDTTAIALLEPLNNHAIWGAIDAGSHVVDLSFPLKKDIEAIDKEATRRGVAVVPGCGVEPGLTDVLAAHGIEGLDKVKAVDIWCGGIPQNPKPPLGYKIVFGGPYLPLYPGPVKAIKGGSECSVPRYTLGEPISFEGIDRPLECYYEGFPETLERLPKFKGVERCTEKTVRYAGYCEKVNFLESCGLLSKDPISIKGVNIAPFEAFSKIIHPKVRLEEGERDITVLRVIVEGEKDGSWASYTFDMVDFYDVERKVTSMAKTTAYTAAIVARMLGRGEIPERGFVTPVKGIRGHLLKHLIDELAKRGVTIKQTYAQRSNTLS
jgi:lysine 6-dehydrogenase